MGEVKEKYQYNRIVIIGNGLDLALGLKTSYSDFLLDYFKNCLGQAKRSKYEDTLLSLNKIGQLIGKDPFDSKTLQDFTENIKKNKYWGIEYYGILEQIMEFKNIENWVDIESLYFDTLIPIVDGLKKVIPNNRNLSLIKEFNTSFGDLSNRLDDYIYKINRKHFDDSILLKYYGFLQNCFSKQINKKTCLNHEIAFKELPNPEHVMFLNFNYTSSVEKLLSGNGLGFHSPIINIHGQAGNPNNPIIFGYGDDTHPYYSKIEEERSNVLLEFIKSFYYNRTTLYHDILGFMELAPYEIYIVGHSCGLSDRTLLKTMFESENCISIKIFHRGTIKEHISKNMAISRHFEDKQKLRKRVLPFDQLATIPQTKR